MVLDDLLQTVENSLLSSWRPSHRKWGWIVYRTTYGNDELWAQFVEAFQRQVREIPLMSEGGLEHVTKYLDFPIWEDQSQFENATAEQLRSHFQAWRISDAAFQEQGFDRNMKEVLWESMRYRYFIRLDEASMQSALDVASGRVTAESWVDLIKVDWPFDENEGEEEDSDEHDFTEGFSPIEGMTTYEVGFQRVPVDDLYPQCWVDKEEMPEKWYIRPPGITYDLTRR